MAVATAPFVLHSYRSGSCSSGRVAAGTSGHARNSVYASGGFEGFAFVGPSEGFGFLVVVGYESRDLVDEFWDGSELSSS